jgi:hypothetical protein
MRHLKAVGLITLAIAALTGASTASATRLCSTNTSPCANVYANNTTFDSHLLSGTSFVFTTSGSPLGINPTQTCGSFTLALTNTNQGGGEGVPVAVKLAALAVTQCTSVNPAGCGSSWTVGSLAGATGTIVSTSGANGTLRFTPPTMTYVCPILGAPVACAFGGSGTLDGTVTGGSPSIIEFVNQFLPSTGGFGCPTAAQVNMRYQTTAPLPLYIATS